MAVSSSSHYSAQNNTEKCKSQSSNSQPSSSLSEIDSGNDTSAATRNKSTGAITCRKRKGGNEEVNLFFSSKLNRKQEVLHGSTLHSIAPPPFFFIGGFGIWDFIKGGDQDFLVKIGGVPYKGGLCIRGWWGMGGGKHCFSAFCW